MLHQFDALFFSCLAESLELVHESRGQLFPYILELPIEEQLDNFDLQLGVQHTLKESVVGKVNLLGHQLAISIACLEVSTMQI